MKEPITAQLSHDNQEEEREKAHIAIVQSIQAGMQLRHPSSGRVGTVEHVHRDGTVYVHFGVTRGMYVADCPHPDHVQALADAERQEKDDRVYLDRRYIRTATAHKAMCTDPKHGATGDGARMVEAVHYKDLEPT